MDIKKYLQRKLNGYNKVQKIRDQELRNLSEDDARAATEALFALYTGPSKERLQSSGLVQQQKYFKQSSD